MERLAKSMPEECKKDWEEVANYNFLKAFDLEEKVDVYELDGHKILPSFRADVSKYAYENWSPKEGDVLVASYPRTGTNWSLVLLHHILYIRDKEMLDMCGAMPMQLLVHECGGPNKFKVLDNIPMPRRVSVTHLPANLINVDSYTKANAKLISVFRNPKDQAYSLYKILPHLPIFKYKPTNKFVKLTWDEFFEEYTSGNIPTGMKDGQWYLDYLLTWLPYRNNKNVLVVCFEDMKKDLAKEVRRIAEHLDVKLSNEDVARVVEECGFKKMNKNIDEGNSDLSNLQKGLGIMRKGQVGDWKNHFTVAQSEAIDKQVKEKLGSTDITFTYEL